MVMRVTSKMQDSRLKMQDSGNLRFLFCVRRLVSLVLFLASCIFFASISYAQEDDGEKDKITDLPPVKIEIIDTTQLNIPRERFRSFTKPDPVVYAPLSSKERSWYLPSTSVPEKLRDKPAEAAEDLLLSLTTSYGAPTMLAYQVLAVKGFGKAGFLLDLGRWMPGNDRTAKLVSDESDGADGLGKSTIDRFKGAFGYQSKNSSLKVDVQYDAKDLGYLDADGNEFPTNDRSLADLSMAWGQKLSDSAQSSLGIGVSKLRMEGPLPSETGDALNVKTDFGVKILWPRSNPIDMGFGVEYLIGEKDTEEFKEAIVRLHLEDNYIRIWRFVLGMGMEMMFDTRKYPPEKADAGTEYAGAEDAGWESNIYPNPFVLLTSQFGSKTILQLGAEGYTRRQNLRELYLDRDYVRFNPELNIERAWHLNASLQYKLTRNFTIIAGGFGKEIKDLVFFGETDDEILSWMPDSWNDSTRISGFSCGWKSSLLGGRVKHSLEYIHESHDQEKHIPYRPMDRGSLSVTYSAPFGLEVSLSGKFCGIRYVGRNDETLSQYSLWEPRISKTFGKHATVFLAAAFYAGRDDYQIWRKYGLPRRMVDFGLTLRF